MKLFRRQKANFSIPEKPQPDYAELKSPAHTAPEMPQRTRLVAIPRLIVLIVVVVGLGIVLANSTRPATAPKKTPAKPGSGHSAQKTPPSPQTTTSSNNAAQSAATGNLADTGPGDVIGWFIITAIVATGLRYRIVLHRLKTD